VRAYGQAVVQLEIALQDAPGPRGRHWVDIGNRGPVPVAQLLRAVQGIAQQQRSLAVVVYGQHRMTRHVTRGGQGGEIGSDRLLAAEQHDPALLV
jgi:hypothetical protein